MEKVVILNFLDQEGENNRLDSFLTTKFSEYSRSFMQKLIKNGHIEVNGEIVSKVSYVLKEEGEIRVKFPEPENFDIEPAKVDFEIVDIQDDFIVVNKPAGLVVHPAPSCRGELTLVHGLLYQFRELECFGDSERPGIVHRLDRGTSGLMVVARNVSSKIKLSALFKERDVDKTYLAVVEGHPDKSGKIDYSIGRHPSSPYKMSHVGFCSRPALTRYEVLEYYKNHSLVEAKIFSGRTHQIRVHFAAIGHGLVGDKTYAHSSKLIDRQALHAWKLSFSLKGKDNSYKADLPDDLKSLIENLKS